MSGRSSCFHQEVCSPQESVNLLKQRWTTTAPHPGGLRVPHFRQWVARAVVGAFSSADAASSVSQIIGWGVKDSGLCKSKNQGHDGKHWALLRVAP